MLFDETVYVANALLFQYLIDSDQDAGLFYFTESLVDGSAEQLHCWAEIHIRIDQRRDVIT